MASNNSGVWKTRGQRGLRIAAAYYQTTWFWRWWPHVAHAGLGRASHSPSHRRNPRARDHRAQQKLMSAQEQERIRIAGELHDGVMQEMLAATMMLGTAKRRIVGDSDAHATIDKVQQKLVQAGTEIRQLSHDLHPPALQEAGCQMPCARTASSSAPIAVFPSRAMRTIEFTTCRVAPRSRYFESCRRHSVTRRNTRGRRGSPSV